MVSWTPELTERSARRRPTRAPLPLTSATGKDRGAVASPTGLLRAAGPPAHPRSTPGAQRRRGSTPPLARPPGDGGSPCPAAAAWHSEELDRLVLASAGRHLLGSPALFSAPGSLRCPSEVFSRSGAKPVPLLNGGRLAARRPLSRTGAEWFWLVKLCRGPVLLPPALDSQVCVGLS